MATRRIYTRSGDRGTTGIHGGTRVPKDDIRIEANGTLDELNCHLGIVRAAFSGSGHPSGGTDKPYRESPASPECPSPVDALLQTVQNNLMTIMSQVATPAAKRAENPNRLPEDLVPAIEAQIDAFTEEAGENSHFLLPGGTPAAAQLQLSRAVCRRAERRLWTLHRQDPLPEAILQYINRLSDLLFVMARCELNAQQWPEERWQAFAYKNKQ